MISDERLAEVADLERQFIAFPPSHSECAEMAKELLALRNRAGRSMPRHEFSQMVNELRDVPSVQSKREKMALILHAFNINPAHPE